MALEVSMLGFARPVGKQFWKKETCVNTEHENASKADLVFTHFFSGFASQVTKCRLSSASGLVGVAF